MVKVLILAAAIILVFAPGGMCRLEFAADNTATPKVVYVSPDNNSQIDLSDKHELAFSWQEVPIPAGGRERYRFTLYKGDTFEVVDNELIDSRTFSVEVPVEKFTAGQKYRWRVVQRDSRSMSWSPYDNWYFTVVKK